jgi:putative FmdB family regulatory protein
VPTYQYACTACGKQLEAVQAFSDAPLTECPACAGTLRKVYSAVGVVFKGSGFYRNDSRSTSTSSDAASTDSGSKKADAAPAAKSDGGSSSSAPAAGSSSSSTSSSTSSTPAAKTA